MCSDNFSWSPPSYLLITLLGIHQQFSHSNFHNFRFWRHYWASKVHANRYEKECLEKIFLYLSPFFWVASLPRTFGDEKVNYVFILLTGALETLKTCTSICKLMKQNSSLTDPNPKKMEITPPSRISIKFFHMCKVLKCSAMLEIVYSQKKRKKN